jgi:iron(III) transport system substrate-binding protein
LSSCGREEGRPEVVLYTSCDDYLLRDVIPPFEKETGIAVRIVGDTEATKTTGLVERLLAEREHPRADVWWSNEPFGTIRLDREGLLGPYTSSAERGFAGGWPAWLRARDGTWYGFALRCRAVVYNTRRLARGGAPGAIEDLAKPEWKGRIGMARPQFGTTRGALGAMLAEAGPGRFRAWVEGLKSNGVRLYDGNSGVVRAAATGEIDVGLTDSDDAFGGEREGWPVAHLYLGFGAGGSPLPIPNTVAEVKGAPHPAQAAALMDYLLSERAEGVLAASDSRNMPVHPAAAEEVKGSGLPVTPVGLEAIAERVPEALRIWDEVFGS